MTYKRWLAASTSGPSTCAHVRVPMYLHTCPHTCKDSYGQLDKEREANKQKSKTKIKLSQVN